MIRFSASEETRTLSRYRRQPALRGAGTDREGRIVFNAQYGQFAGGVADGVPVGVPRLFAGQPGEQAIYRLSRAGRDGRPASEDIR